MAGHVLVGHVCHGGGACQGHTGEDAKRGLQHKDGCQRSDQLSEPFVSHARCCLPSVSHGHFSLSAVRAEKLIP